MAKFKIGDRVRVVRVDGKCGWWISRFVGKEGVVVEDSASPNVCFDCGETDWGSEDYLVLVEEPKKDESASKTETQPMIVNVTVTPELTNITIGGKRFRLVAED